MLVGRTAPTSYKAALMSILQLVAKCTPQAGRVPLDLSPLLDWGSDKGLWADPATLIHLLNG